MRAFGASPKAAIPAGRESTPAPTIHLTRLKTSFGIVAVPFPTEFSSCVAKSFVNVPWERKLTSGRSIDVKGALFLLDWRFITTFRRCRPPLDTKPKAGVGGALIEKKRIAGTREVDLPNRRRILLYMF